MSEVKRISVFMHGPNKKVDMVEAAHFDRVTAERDAALGHERLLAKELHECRVMAVMILEKEWAEHVGNGLASSQVESAFTQLHNELSEARQALTAEGERADVLERDKVRIDWLADQPVDTLYLDDGRIIDIAGRVDLRDAIDAAMAAPRPTEDLGDD